MVLAVLALKALNWCRDIPVIRPVVFPGQAVHGLQAACICFYRASRMKPHTPQGG